jgi:hypothetical protein
MATWDSDDVTDDVLVGDGTMAYTFTASGAIYGGQIVEIQADNAVKTSTTGSEGIGVAAYDADHGDEVAVFGPGNVVRLCVDASGSAGTTIYADANGVADTTAASTERIMGYQLEAATSKTTNYFGKVLLV